MRRVLAFLCLLAWPALASAQDATTSGSLTAPAQTVTLTLSRYSTASVQVTGAWTGTLTLQASIDATNYFTVSGVRAGAAGSASSTTANDTLAIPVAGYTRVRVLASALSAGTAVVTIRATDPGWAAPATALDNGAFAFGATTTGVLGAVVDDVATNTVTENSAGAPRMSTGRVLFGNLRNESGSLGVSVAATNTSFGATANALMVGGYHNSGVILALPIQPAGFNLPDTNSYAVSVSNRDSLETNGLLIRRSTFTPVGAIDNINTNSWNLVVGSGNTVTTNPANTYGLQTRDLGQSYATSGSLSAAGSRYTISNRFIRWSANLFRLVPSGSFVGTMQPVVSLDNGANWSYTVAVNVDTRATVTLLTDNAEAVGTYTIPMAAGATDYGWEMVTRTAGSVSMFSSANTGTSALFAAGDWLTDAELRQDPLIVTVGQEDDSIFNPTSTFVVPAGAVVDDAAPAAVTEGNVGAPRMSGRRELYSQIRDAAGNERGVNVTAANALKVDGSAITQPVQAQRAATPSVTSVAGSAASVTCLALNANRLGATIYNDSTADLYIKLGATASVTSFTVKAFTDGFFTVPFGYTGVIDCIWSSATGNARVTEVTQ